MHSVNVNI